MGVLSAAAASAVLSLGSLALTSNKVAAISPDCTSGFLSVDIQAIDPTDDKIFSGTSDVPYAVYRVQTVEGFSRLGDLGFGSHVETSVEFSPNKDHLTYPNYGILVSDENSDGSILANPTGYEQVWLADDSSTSIWSPVAPSGYTCLGHVFQTSNSEPELDYLSCVLDAYVTSAPINSLSELWTNTGNGDTVQVSTLETAIPDHVLTPRTLLATLEGSFVLPKALKGSCTQCNACGASGAKSYACPDSKLPTVDDFDYDTGITGFAECPAYALEMGSRGEFNALHLQGIVNQTAAPVPAPIHTLSPTTSVPSAAPTGLQLDFAIDITSGETDFFTDRRTDFVITLFSNPGYDFDDIDLENIKFGKPGSEVTLSYSSKDHSRADDENGDGIIDVPYEQPVDELGYENDDLSLVSEVELVMTATVISTGKEITGSVWFDITGNEEAIRLSIPTESPTAAPVAPTISPQPTELVVLDFSIDITSGETDFFTDRRTDFAIILFSNDRYDLDDIDLENIKFGKPGSEVTLIYSSRDHSRADDENNDGIVDVPYEQAVNELGYENDDLSLVSEVELVMTATLKSTGKEITGSVWFDITGNEEAIRLSIPTDSPTAAPVAPTISPMPTVGCIEVETTDFEERITSKSARRGVEVEIKLISSAEADLSLLSDASVLMGPEGNQVTPTISRSRKSDDIELLADLQEMGFDVVGDVEHTIFVTGELTNGESICGEAKIILTT